MKKYLLTLLFVVATSNITLAGPYVKTLNVDIITSGFSRKISGGVIEVRSTDDTYTFTSSCMSYLDVENKIAQQKSIYNNGTSCYSLWNAYFGYIFSKVSLRLGEKTLR